MRWFFRTTGRLWSDTRGLSNIEFAMISASLAIAISAAILAYGLGITTENEARIAAADQDDRIDRIVTGSIEKTETAARETAAPQRHCPEQPPVVILRR